MPPFESVPLVEVPCGRCGSTFQTKRPNLAKWCGRCKQRVRPHRYDPVTKKRWRDGLSAERKAAIQAKSTDRAKRVKVWIAEYKVAQGCADCGYRTHHAALDFDHVRGKKLLNVCLSKSIAQARQEIEKCEVVCANCHRIRTYERATP
jgi:hypothetical protein